MVEDVEVMTMDWVVKLPFTITVVAGGTAMVVVVTDPEDTHFPSMQVNKGPGEGRAQVMGLAENGFEGGVESTVQMLG